MGAISALLTRSAGDGGSGSEAAALSFRAELASEGNEMVLSRP
jgi:hypothetical protein